MLDPLPPPPNFLYTVTKPFADALALPSLPYHIHEVVLALTLYQCIESIISPFLSNLLFPKIYKSLTRRTRVNWDVHVVSFVQSCLINALALWVIFTDEERKQMKGSVVERVYGYTGASALIQGLACGYFIWDLIVSTRFLKIFGVGIWCHAITALCVFSFGFRPFANYYGPVFILYELSSPFLNIHWFCDKLNLTGSKLQWYNGMLLLFTFFCCRLVWGTYQSARVYYDVWQILHVDPSTALHEGVSVVGKTGRNIFGARDGQMCLGDRQCITAQMEVMKFVDETTHVPYWLIVVYLVSNLTLNALNWYWFGKMIETVRKRFDGKPVSGHEREESPRERRKSVVEHAADALDREVLTGPTETANDETDGTAIASGRDGGSEIGKRRKDL